MRAQALGSVGREIVGEIFQNAFEVMFQSRDARLGFRAALITPFGKLARNHFLNGLAGGEVRRDAGAVRMKSFLLTVRHAARSGASINPVMNDAVARCAARPA
jgi:hypothetical protein